MKILTLSNCPLDASQGSGYVILGYARGLRALGHEVDLLGPAELEPFHGTRRAIRYRLAAGMARRVLPPSTTASYDVIELYGGEGWLAASLLAGRRQRRYLVVSHSNGLEALAAENLARAGVVAPPSPRWSLPAPVGYAALVERTYRRVDALVTVSDFERDFALRRGYQPPERVLALDNPLPEVYLGRRPSWDREQVVGFCGSWLPGKGTALLCSDVPELLRELPDCRFVLVGVGEGFDAAEHFPADVLPQITVCPRARRDTELAELYQTFAVHVMPSASESFGLVAAEGMACGSALVASRVGFAASLDDGEEALLLPDLSPGTLQRTVRILLADEDRRQRIAKAGHRRVQTLRWPTAAETLATTYVKWLEEHRRERTT